MKHLLCFILMLMLSFPVLSYEDGGVDVGNAGHKGKISVPQFNTEKELIAYLEAEIPKIENGRNPEVILLIRRGRCSSKRVVFQEMEIEISYRWEPGLKKLVKEFSGVVSVNLKSCASALRQGLGSLSF